MTARVTRLHSNLDKLIDWYRKFNPSLKKISVNMTAKECGEFAQEYDGEFTYRGYTIVPQRKSK